MKKITLIFILSLAFNFILKAQAPQGFNYQAVARTSTGVAVTNQAIGLQIRLLQGSSSGTAVYTETHSVTSNNIGLLNVVVGLGNTTDNFSTINWANGPYFIEISMDITGASTYVLMGTQQLMSVPYALYAANGGTSGATGTTGAVGATGDMGATGGIGITGATGDIGPTGTNGTNGTDGATGATGTSGFNGDRYATTSTDLLTIVLGNQSFTVAPGLQYSVGQTVLIANSVSNFMKGNCVSYNSITGVLIVNATIIGGSGAFSSWDVNLDGATGPAGVMGATGATGVAGTNGTDGATGTAGTNGVNGASGATGTNGTNGTNGSAGATGTNGTNGATGATGTNGTNGVDGATGIAGATGTNGTNGATGATGTNGTTGTNGATGITGATGATATYAVAFNLVDNGAFSAWLIGSTSDYNSGSNSNPTLTLYRGFTYQFNVNVSGHPFRIQSVNAGGGALYTVGITPLAQNVQNGILTFKVPMDAPTQLYYYCGFHPGMHGIINIP